MTRGAQSVPGMLLITTLATLWTGIAQADENLQISQAWIREAPPGAPTQAGYLCLDNRGDADVMLTGVSSPAFKHIMMHRTESVDNTLRMLHQKEVVVPAGKQVCFEPGGLHLMMPAPEQRLNAGDQVELILQFSKSPCKQIQVPVKTP